MFCARCATELQPGVSDLYLVRIEAFADPSPPDLDKTTISSGRPVSEQIRGITDELGDTSEQELADQVHRRMTIHLCGPCYRRWIESPVSGDAPKDGSRD